MPSLSSCSYLNPPLLAKIFLVSSSEESGRLHSNPRVLLLVPAVLRASDFAPSPFQVYCLPRGSFAKPRSKFFYSAGCNLYRQPTNPTNTPSELDHKLRSENASSYNTI